LVKAIEQIEFKSKIYTIRGVKVMLDRDLAELYDVPTKRLNEQVKRNISRFPNDFMFQLTKNEAEEVSRSQIATLKQGQNIKYLPLAFTEQGVAMLSGILNSDRAIEVNIQIMRAFVQLRRFAQDYAELSKKIEVLERKYDGQFKVVFEALKHMFEIEAKPKKIGFLSDRK